MAVHSLLQISREELIAIPKKGSSLGKINTTLNAQTFQNYKNIQFYGHAAIAANDTEKFYIVEKEKDKFFVFVRSTKTLERVGAPVYSSEREIHMVEFFDDNLVMCVDDFNNPAVVFLKIKTKQAIEHKIPQKHFRPGHLFKDVNSKIFSAGISGQKYEKGGLGVLFEDNIELIEKDKLLNMKPLFWFSQAQHSDLLCAVSPYSDRVVFINNKNYKITKEFSLKLPQGVVTYNEQYLIVSSEGITVFDKEGVFLKTTRYKTTVDLLEDFHPVLI